MHRTLALTAPSCQCFPVSDTSHLFFSILARSAPHALDRTTFTGSWRGIGPEAYAGPSGFDCRRWMVLGAGPALHLCLCPPMRVGIVMGGATSDGDRWSAGAPLSNSDIGRWV